MLIRHWESSFNKKWLIQWHSQNSVLTEKWKTQIIELIPIIKNLVFDIVYVSDLNRAKESWNILSPHIDVENIIYTSQLREQAQWLFEWLSYTNNDFQTLKEHENLNDYTYKQLVEKYQIESKTMFQNRINAFFNSIDENKNILCITHWWIIESKIGNEEIKNGKIYILNKKNESNSLKTWFNK